MIMINQIMKQLNIYVWAKDKNYKYLYCNEHFAKAAGLDSPEQIVGKSDHQLYWKQFANYYQVNDYWVMQGHTRTNVPEVIDTVNNIKDILVTETPLLDKSNQCIGVGGAFIDITGKQLVKKTGYYDQIKKRYYFDDEVLGNLYLSAREITVFKHILLGYSARQMGEKIKISSKTVESYIESIRSKLQAKNKGEIIATAIQFGLTHILYLQTQDIVIHNT
jgi:DNA-binding CsgD family transcriptional regulator